MYLVPWIISGVLAISLAYIIWLYRKVSKPVSTKDSHTNESMDIDAINNSVRSAFSPYGFKNQNQFTDIKSFEAVLYDSIMGIKERIEDAKYVETLIRLEPILHDLESLACAEGTSKEVSAFVTNTIQLIENTLGIYRINDYNPEQSDNSKYWANYEPGEAGYVEKRYSPWMYDDEVIIQGVLQRRQDATE